MMYIGEVEVRHYADFIKRGVINKSRLVDFIIESEECSKEDAEIIASYVVELLEE